MKSILLFVFVFLSIGTGSIIGFPETQISNGLIRVKLYLPDSKNGYYRGGRFDWSGVIPELEFKGHSYFGQWFEKHNPTSHDAIMGPVEAFSPLDYPNVRAGDAFVKIGIGALLKPDDSDYSFSRSYPLLNGGEWTFKKEDNQIQFIHVFQDKEYGYEYKKIVQLVEGEPRMVLKHSLKNTGRKTIESDVYNHNFFVIDQQATGPDFTVRFPFLVSTEQELKKDLVDLSGNEILFKRRFSAKETAFMNMKGFSERVKDYNIRIENHKTGAGVSITSDQPLSQLVFWAAEKTISPEPYIHLNVQPGEVFHWDINYDFYLL